MGGRKLHQGVSQFPELDGNLLVAGRAEGSFRTSSIGV